MALETGTSGSTLVERAKRILIEPKTEWPRIDAEPATVAGLFKGWVLILAAVPAVASLVGSLLFGYRILGLVYRPSIGEAVGTAIAQYVMAVVGVFVTSLIIDALAPSFGGTKNSVQATKVAAYSVTASWLAGVLAIIPQLAWIAALAGGAYSIYLLWLGLPLLMKVAADKAAAYTISVIVAAIIVFAVLFFIANSVGSALGPSRMPVADSGSVSGTLTLPGAGTVDVGKLEEATKRMEESAKRLQAGQGQPAVAPTTLEALLPASLGAYRRVELSSSGANAGGMGGSTAEARYQDGDSSFDLRVSDIAAAGAIAAMGAAFNVQSNRQTENGYEKSGVVDGRMTSEKWDKQAGTGEYSTLVADRFMVEASGKVPSIDVLRGAVNSLGLARLESLKG